MYNFSGKPSTLERDPEFGLFLRPATQSGSYRLLSTKFNTMQTWKQLKFNTHAPDRQNQDGYATFVFTWEKISDFMYVIKGRFSK